MTTKNRYSWIGHGRHEGGPAGFWIFCKSYLEPKSSKVLVISFEHL